MGSLKRVVLIMVVVSIGSMENRVSATENSTAGPNETDKLEDLLDKGFAYANEGIKYIYEMTRFFLEVVVHQTYLTEMQDKVNLNSTDEILNTFPDNWQTWSVHFIGFAVCFALGVVLFIVMLLTCLIFPCCRCCGRCGSPNPKKPKSISKKFKIGCTVALCTVTLGLVLGAAGMFVTNQIINDQLNGGLFESIDSALDGVQSYLNQTNDDIIQGIYGKFLQTEKIVLDIIENVPKDSIKAIDNATGAVTTLNQLSNFSSHLEELQYNLLLAQSLAPALDAKTKNLEADLSTITSTVSSCSSKPCDDLRSTIIAVDFSVIDVTAAIAAVNMSIEYNLQVLVQNSLQQFDDIEESVNSTVSPHVSDMTASAKDMESEIFNNMQEIKKIQNSIDLEPFRQDIDDIGNQDVYQMSANISYGVFLALSCIITIVIFFNILGLILGWCLRQTKGSISRCECSSAVGYHLLTTSTAITLVFYWLFSLLVAVLFVAGGLVHTELCRNILNFDHTKSAQVLTIYDGWCADMIASDVPIKPFQIYSNCHKNQSFYTAFNLGSVWNISSFTDSGSDAIKEATDSFKGSVFDIPKVNLSDPILISVLRVLDKSLSEPSLSFPFFYDHTEGNITSEDINSLANDLDSVNLVNQASDLRSLYTTQIIPIIADQEKLLDALRKSESIIRSVSFGDTAGTLIRSDETINKKGNYIISEFVNATADNINAIIDQYVTGVTFDVEENIGYCAPFYHSLKTGFDGFCVDFLYSLNGFWFSLGWCMFFLIPSLFLSVHLAFAFKTGTTANSIKHKD